MSESNLHLSIDEMRAKADRRKAVPVERCGSCANFCRERIVFWCDFLDVHTSTMHVCNEWIEPTKKNEEE